MQFNTPGALGRDKRFSLHTFTKGVQCSHSVSLGGAPRTSNQRSCWKPGLWRGLRNYCGIK